MASLSISVPDETLIEKLIFYSKSQPSNILKNHNSHQFCNQKLTVGVGVERIKLIPSVHP